MTNVDLAASGNGARARLLTVAERLFSERGYTAVTLRDIANDVGIRQASLYYYFPDGKEQLFVAVTEQGLIRVTTELAQVATETSHRNLREQLNCIANVLLDQPPIDLARMIRSDMPAISREHAERLTRKAFEALIEPLARVFRAARERGEQRIEDDLLLAGWFLAMIETAQIAERFSPRSSAQMASEMIAVLIDGVQPR